MNLPAADRRVRECLARLGQLAAQQPRLDSIHEGEARRQAARPDLGGELRVGEGVVERAGAPLDACAERVAPGHRQHVAAARGVGDVVGPGGERGAEVPGQHEGTGRVGVVERQVEQTSPGQRALGELPRLGARLAAADRLGGEVRGQDAADPVGAEPLGQAIERLDRERARRHVQPGHLDQLRLELQAQVGALDPLELALEHLDAAADIAADAQHGGQRNDRAHPCLRVAGGVGRLAQVPDRAQVAGLRLGAAGEHQQRATPLRSGRLGKRPAKQPSRRLGGAAGRGRVGGRGERVDDPRLARGVDLEQVCRRALRLGSGGDEHPRRVAVKPRAVGGGDPGHDRGADEGMRERRGRRPREQARALHRRQRVEGARAAASGQRGDVRGIRVVAQHGDGARGRGRVRADALEPPAHGRGKPVGHDLPDARRGRRDRLDSRLRQRAQVHGEQQRVASGGGVTGRHELGVGAVHHRRDRRDAQRARPDGARRRRAQHRSDELLVDARLVRPQREADLRVHTLQPREHIGERAQRRRVGPVQVVDREEQRLLPGQPGEQPVQPVQHGEAGGARRRVERRPRRRRVRLEHRRGQRGGAGEELRREHRLQQLPDDAERQLALELAGPRDEHARAVGPRGRGGDLEQTGLADPGGAFDHQQRDAVPHTPPQLRKLPLPSDQHRAINTPFGCRSR